MAKAFLHFRFLSERRDEDDGDVSKVGACFNGIGELIAIAIGHRDIGKDQVSSYTCDKFQALNTIGSKVKFVVGRAQHHAEEFLDQHFVLAKDNSSHHVPLFLALVGEADGKMKDRAFAQDAFRPDLSAMHLDDFAYNRQFWSRVLNVE